jgi:hypothetical protein
MSDAADRLAQAIRDLIDEAVRLPLDNSQHSRRQNPGHPDDGSLQSPRPGKNWAASAKRRSTNS